MSSFRNRSYTYFIAGLFSALLSSFFTFAQQADAGNVVYFDLNMPSLNAAANHTIDAMLRSRKISNGHRVLLYGYADYLGTRAHNDSLSAERAMNVRAYLIRKGIAEGDITICVGKGQVDREPRADKKGYAQDRKVEIITDEYKMQRLTCRPLARCEPLQWSKNVSSLNVHAAAASVAHELTDNTISIMLPNGDKYTGEINEYGTKVSGGVYTWADGSQYAGAYNNDQKEGGGTCTWPNGDKLKGTWLADEIVAGTLIIPYNGVIYHADAGHTHSDVAYAGNLEYAGKFAHNMFNGIGVAVWPNGDRYEGNWRNDKMNGQGTYKWSSGMRYEGQWTDNKMNGRGVMVDGNGNLVQQGIWEDDVFKKQ